MKKRSEDEDDHTELEEQVVEDEEDQEGEHQQQKSKGKGKATAKSKGKSTFQAGPTTWKKADISNPPLRDYNHEPPLFVESPLQYFFRSYKAHNLRN